MKAMMNVIQSTYIGQNDWQNALQEFLFSYRITPLSSTQIPPADLMYLHDVLFVENIFFGNSRELLSRTIFGRLKCVIFGRLKYVIFGKY